MSMFKNKLYKLALLVFTIFITSIIAYALSLIVSSVVLSTVFVITKRFTNFFVDNYLLIWLLSSIIPSIPFMIKIWKDQPSVLK